MMRLRRSRGWVIAGALLVVEAVILATTTYTLHAIGQNARALVLETARQAPDVFRIYRARHATLAEASPDIVQHLRREGVRILIVERRTTNAYVNGNAMLLTGSAAPPPPFKPVPNYGSRKQHPDRGPLGFLATQIGAKPEVVHISGVDIVLLPDFGRIANAVTLTLGISAGLIVLVFVAFAIVGAVLRASAMRPMIETTESLERLASGDFTPRMIAADGGGHIARLAGAYNAAAETVAGAISERLASEAEMQRFIADAGHELRTPLTIVMGYVDVLEGKAVAPELAARVFAGMRAETQRMRGLIDKLITLARLESPLEGRAPVAVDPVDVVRRVAAALAPLAAARTIIVDAPVPMRVLADQTELYESVLNCVENALKYAPQSEIHIRVEESGDDVGITITDDGPGMSDEDLAHAFDRFYRGDSRGEVAGSGLGLAIVKRSIERLGGRVELASAPGSGTRVTLRLRRAQGALPIST